MGPLYIYGALSSATWREVCKVVHGPVSARAGAGYVYPGQRAVSLARLAHWGRYGPLWAAMCHYGPLWTAMGRYGPLRAAVDLYGAL